MGLDGHTAKLNETTLEPGDIVAFYSDGVTEARSPAGEEFGRRRLADFLLRAARDRQSPAQTVRRLAHHITQYQGAVTADDATVLLVGWRP